MHAAKHSGRHDAGARGKFPGLLEREPCTERAFRRLCGELGLNDSFCEVGMVCPEGRFQVQDVFLQPSPRAFKKHGLEALKASQGRNHQRGLLLPRDNWKRLLAVRTYGVVEYDILKAGTRKKLPYIQHSFIADAVTESARIMREIYDDLIRRSYSFQIIGDSITVIIEQGLSKAPVSEKKLALVLAAAEEIGALACGKPVEAFVWLRTSGSKIADKDFFRKAKP